MKTETLTLGQVKDFAIVAVALLALVVLLGNFVRTLRDWRRPGLSAEEWRRSIDLKMDRDNKRIQSLEDGNKAICKGVLALLNHEINGNSADKLEAARMSINDYLIENR